MAGGNRSRISSTRGKGANFFDTIIIGAGPAGLSAAELLASAGQKVALVEASQKLGGECLNYGCIPTKAMLGVVNAQKGSAAKLKLVGAERAAKLNLGRLISYADKLVKSSGRDDLEKLVKFYGIRLIRGRGYLLGKNEVDAGGILLKANNIILAPGGEPVVPNIPGLSEAGFMTYKSFMKEAKRRVPRKVAIIGGGRVGCEYAQILRACGVAVCIIESSDLLLGDCETELSEIAKLQLEEEGVEVLTGADVESVSGSIANKEVKLRQGRSLKSVKCDAIFVASGKALQSELGLENAGIEIKGGRIPTNQYCQSPTGNIYAIGDVAGPLSLTSTALLQAKAAAANILARSKKELVSLDYSDVPSAPFSYPEAASVGPSTNSLREGGFKFKVSLVDLSQTAKAKVDPSLKGFVKIWFDEKSRSLLGGCIVGPGASEAISSLSLAIASGMRLEDLEGIGAVFPSVSEAIRLAAEEAPR